MIFGNGLLGKAFKAEFSSDPDVCIFASGVSNSRTIDEIEFDREIQTFEKMLGKLNEDARLVYFSTCSVFDPDVASDPYVKHKQFMERLVVESNRRYLIARLPQIVSRSVNPNTLTNFLFDKIRRGERFTVWRFAKRSLIDIDDIQQIVTHLVRDPFHDTFTANVANPNLVPVISIIEEFERILEMKASFDVSERGSDYSIDVSGVIEVAGKLGISFDDGYLTRTLRKYYESDEQD